MAEAQTKAEKLAANFDGDPKGLPKHVQEAIDDVEYHSLRQNTLLDASLAREEISEDEHADHPRRVYRFEEVDGEIVEISKNGKQGKTKITYRPDLAPPDQVNLADIDPSNVDQLLAQDDA